MLEVIRKFSISVLFGFGFGFLSTIYVGGIWDWVNGLLFIISLYFLFIHPILSNGNKSKVVVDDDGQSSFLKDTKVRNKVIGYFLQVVGFGIGYCIRFIIKDWIGV